MATTPIHIRPQHLPSQHPGAGSFRALKGPAAFLLPAAVLFFVMSRHRDPPGLDGFFYLKQTLSLAQGRGFYFKDYSLAFFPPVIFTRLLGDPAAFRVSLALAFGGAIAASVSLGERLLPAGKRMSAPFYAAALISLLLAFPLYRFSLNYYKNLVCVLLFLSALRLILSAVVMPLRLLGTTALILAGVLTHKMGIFFAAILLAAAAFTPSGAQEYPDNPLRCGARRIAGIAAAACAVFALFLWHYEKAPAVLAALIPKGLHPAAYREGLLAAPALAINLCFSLAAAVWGAANLRYEKRREQRAVFLVLLLILCAACAPLQDPAEDSVQHRLLLMLPLILIPCLALFDRVRLRHCSCGILLVSAFGLAQGLSWGSSKDHLAALFPDYSAKIFDTGKVKEFVTPEDYLVAHHGLEFYVDYVTGIRAWQFISPDETVRQFRIIRRTEEIREKPAAMDLVDQLKLADLGPDYALLREDDWRSIVKTEGIHSDNWNPMRRRPAHFY